MLFGYAHAVCAACAGMRLVQLSLLAAWLSMHFGQGQLGPSVGRLSRIIKCVEGIFIRIPRTHCEASIRVCLRGRNSRSTQLLSLARGA